MRLKIIGILVIIGFIVMTMVVGCERIDAGHVGIKVNMTGGSQGVSHTEYVTGWNFYIRSIQKIYEFPTYQQHKEYEEYVVPAKGGIPFQVHPTFNYNLNAGEISGMFQRYRVSLEQLENGYLKNAMTTTIREVTNTFSVDSLLNNQTGYDIAILTRLNQQLAPYFVVSQFTANLTPDGSLKEAIVNKAKAIQQVQVANANVAVAEANARISLTNSRKDSAITVMTAESEARAIQVKQSALQQSPQYIDLIKAQNWDGKLPTTMLSSGSNTLFSLK